MNMHQSNLRAVDLNLLVVFQALMEQRSVTKAGEKIGLTQPAMSRAFGRIKDLFGDEILVRGPDGYQPTQRALQIFKELEATLPRISALIHKQDFNPSKAVATVRIAATDYAATVILSKLVRTLAMKAPGICIEVSPWNDNAFLQLERGELDLALWVNAAPEGFRQEVLFRETFVCLVREGHPIKKKTLTLKQYLHYPHVVVSLMKNQQLVVEQALDEINQRRTVLARVPYFAAGVWLLEGTDAIISVGKRLADKLANHGPFKVLLPPVEIKGYNYLQAWHPRTESDPILAWVRGQIKECSTAD